ncbi:MAG: hypothetical protein KAH17_05310 [Bacteroidales bacterium]|nr:hypothetical protein [Bacteroidales bacterium]
MKRSFIQTLLVTGLILLTTGLTAQEITSELFSQLRYRHIGPPGNRTSAVVGVPGNDMVSYIGASSGGIWKTTDRGGKWFPIFDDMEAQSIGAIAIAPSDPNVVWTGTGEAFIRSNVSIGNGVYKSTDAGKTWKHMGLDLTGRVGRIVIDPRNPDIVLVAALGHCYGPQKERGIFKTTDGGETWKHVLFADENTGCFEIAMRPDNPRILFAGMWPLEIKTYGRESGGPNSGVYKSTDGGDTWKKLEGNGLPSGPIGKVGIAIANSNPDVVYAMMETGAPNNGVLWKSTDGGDRWKLVSRDRLLNERPHYASRIMVNPADENLVYFAANSHSISYDGGVTTERSGWSGDTHDMWADPLNPDRMMISDDAVVIMSYNRGVSWSRVKLPIAQMYHVAVDDQIPYNVYGGKQDGPGYKGTSMSRGSDGDWASTAGGECGFIVPDPEDSNIVWGGSYVGQFTRLDYRTGHNRTVMIWPESTYGAAGKDATYRVNWTFPIEISPHDHNTVYVGSQYVHKTSNEGQSWEIISPDLSTNNPDWLQPSGGLTKDNIGVEFACLIFALAESPIEKGCIWAGTNDGLVQITRDGGKNWVNVTKNIPNLPPDGTVSNLEPSRYQAGTCYLTVDFHQMNNRDPFVYKTTNYGKTWKFIGEDIPKSVFSYCHWIHEDPVKEGLLYLGTENAIYFSFNDGKTWLPVQNNMPHAPVHHMVVQEHFNDLVVGTYGRGFWIMDDITPLQQLNNKVVKSDLHLFKSRSAYRFHRKTGSSSGRASANINYYLKEATQESIKITVSDENGKVISTLRGKGSKGINRVNWGMRYPGAESLKLRIKPEGNPTVVEEKRYRDTWIKEGWYPFQSWGTSGGLNGYMVAPGEYTVTIEWNGNTQTQTLMVLKDPSSAGSQAEIEENIKLLHLLQTDINKITKMINDIEWKRKLLADDLVHLKGNDGNNVDIKNNRDIDKKLATIENKLLQSISREGDSKSFRYPNLLYSKLSVLAGDISKNFDFAPNQQQYEVFELLHEQLLNYELEYKEIR